MFKQLQNTYFIILLQSCCIMCTFEVIQSKRHKSKTEILLAFIFIPMKGKYQNFRNSICLPGKTWIDAS